MSEQEPHVYQAKCPVSGETFETVSPIRRFSSPAAKAFYSYYKVRGLSDPDIHERWKNKKLVRPEHLLGRYSSPKKK